MFKTQNLSGLIFCAGLILLSSLTITAQTISLTGSAAEFSNQNNFFSSIGATAEVKTFVQQAKLLANDGISQDNLGYSVAISGDTAIVGAPRASGGTGLQSRGAAYIYIRNSTGTWSQQAKLTPADGAANDQFGYAVAINGDTAIVGRQNTTVGVNRADGKVYVFTRSGSVWTETQTLVSSDLAQGDLFGNALAFEGDTLLIGAFNKNNSSNFFQGAAYVFTRPGAGGAFTEQAKLIATDGAASDFFGYSVALSGDTAVIGAVEAPLSGIGKAYVFVRSGATWSQQQKLIADDRAAGDAFGFSVGVSGDTAVVGARLDDNGSVGDQGSAYVFVRSGAVWTQQQKLLGVEPTQRNDQFGSAVAIRGETIAVGSPAHEFIGSIANHGAVYIFNRSGAVWSRSDKLAHDDPAPDAFGQALAFDGNSILTGAPSKSSARGAAYVFKSIASVGQSKLVGGVDLFSGTGYGSVVAISNDTALTGSLNWGTNLFVRNGENWQFVRKLSATVTGNDTAPFSNGGAVIAGDLMMVGSPTSRVGGVNAAGAVYVFNRVNGNWVDGQRILAPEDTALQNFGSTLALSGDTLAVGAPNKTVGSNQNQGAVYVFVRSGETWIFQQKLTAPDGAAQDFFAQSLAVSGDTIIAGAHMAEVGSELNQGAAYIFTRGANTWSLQQKLVGSDSNANDSFGLSVAVDGDFAVIGASFKEVGDNFTAGAAYVFTRTGTVWSEQQRLQESDSGSEFARSLALSADRLVIGQARYSNQATGIFNQGAIYVYKRSGSALTRRGRLVAYDGATADQLGSSVAVAGNLVIGGAPGKNLYGSPSVGAAYVFDLTKIRFGSAAFDFDGDGKADFSVYRGGNWFVNRSSDNQFWATQFGAASDRITPADFDGDGKTDTAVYRDGSWFILQSSNGQFTATIFGAAEDMPVPADYDGDGKADIAVFRPSNGTWYKLHSSDGQFAAIQFGANGDKPALGDYDGDGKADISVYRPSDGAWYRLNSSNNEFIAVQFGSTADLVVPADYDGDGKTDIAVYRPAEGNWYRLNSSDGSFAAATFGNSTDRPVPADYDGDGKADVAVYRGGFWYINQSSNNTFQAALFGLNTDIPIPNIPVR